MHSKIKSRLAYFAILLLLALTLLQIRSCDSTKSPIIHSDTVYITKYVYIHDTIKGNPIFIKEKIDTSVWMKKAENKPDTSYNGLLSQYKSIGNRHFSTNIFRTDFKIQYGTISVIDTVQENRLVGNQLITNLQIPEKITTITKEITLPPKRELYLGIIGTGEQKSPVSGVYAGSILKTKKQQLYNLSIGYNGNISFMGGIYWKFK